MTKPFSAVLCLTFSVAFALSACKPKPGEPTAAQKAEAAAAAAGTTAPAAAPAAAPATAPAQASSTAVADLDKIAVIAKPLPPFPFIDYPPVVPEGMRFTDESDFDQVAVIVGGKAHMVEGRVKLTNFHLDDAKISEFQARRDYTKAALDMGGVKVNTVVPNDDAFYDANGAGGDSEEQLKLRSSLQKKLRYESNHSYDAYFLPTATGRKWLVLMINDSDVRLFAIEEKSAASSVKLVASAAPVRLQ